MGACHGTERRKQVRGNTTRQLEDLLRQGLPEAEARLVQSELERRYSEALGPPQTPSGHQRPRVEMPPPPATQSSRNPGTAASLEPGQPSPIGGPAQQPLSRPPSDRRPASEQPRRSASQAVRGDRHVRDAHRSDEHVFEPGDDDDIAAVDERQVPVQNRECAELLYLSQCLAGRLVVRLQDGVSTFRGTIQ